MGKGMEEITIYRFQLETISEALRITSNIHNSREGATCHDRQVRQAYEYSKNAMEGNKDIVVRYMSKPPLPSSDSVKSAGEKKTAEEILMKRIGIEKYESLGHFPVIEQTTCIKAINDALSQQGGEAVEFAEWRIEEGWTYNYTIKKHHNIHMGSNSPTFTTQQLFNLFITK